MFVNVVFMCVIICDCITILMAFISCCVLIVVATLLSGMGEWGELEVLQGKLCRGLGLGPGGGSVRVK